MAASTKFNSHIIVLHKTQIFVLNYFFVCLSFLFTIVQNTLYYYSSQSFTLQFRHQFFRHFQFSFFFSNFYPFSSLITYTFYYTTNAGVCLFLYSYTQFSKNKNIKNLLCAFVFCFIHSAVLHELQI